LPTAVRAAETMTMSSMVIPFCGYFKKWARCMQQIRWGGNKEIVSVLYVSYPFSVRSIHDT